MTTEEFITVGQLGRPRGTGGEIYVTPLTDFPERFEKMTEIYISGGDNWTKMKIISSQMISDRPVLRLENIESPEDAARLTNKYLAVPKSEIIKPPQDSFYIFELIGADVFDEETKRRVGTIHDVEKFPANDVYVIKTADGRKLSLAAVRRYVKNVDIQNKRVVIDSAGLIE